MTGTPASSPSADMQSAWPTEIRLAPDKRTLSISFEDGSAIALDAEYLRVSSPSAEVRGHGPADRTLVFGKRNVAIRALEPVGNYAVRIVFDDGHDTGLFTWPYLRKLAAERAQLWQDYLAELEAKGLSRG